MTVNLFLYGFSFFSEIHTLWELIKNKANMLNSKVKICRNQTSLSKSNSLLQKLIEINQSTKHHITITKKKMSSRTSCSKIRCFTPFGFFLAAMKIIFYIFLLTFCFLFIPTFLPKPLYSTLSESNISLLTCTCPCCWMAAIKGSSFVPQICIFHLETWIQYTFKWFKVHTIP